jgi:predicted GNAT family acetyltransferase
VRLVRATLLEPLATTAAVSASPAVEIRREREAHRYVATTEGLEVGRLTYEPAERVVVLLRTDADATTGVGDALLRRALDDVRNEGSRRVVAVCPYASWWIDRHAAYAPLLLPR